MWKDYLVPDLLQGYVNYLMKQDTTNKNFIGLNEFVLIYSALIRGSTEEKAQTIAGVIGYRKNSAGIKTVSYNNLVKVRQHYSVCSCCTFFMIFLNCKFFVGYLVLKNNHKRFSAGIHWSTYMLHLKRWTKYRISTGPVNPHKGVHT